MHDHAAQLHAQGMGLARGGDPRAAVPLLEQALRQAPNYADCYNTLGLTTSMMKEVTRARKLIEQAIAIDPQHSNAQVNLAGLYLNHKPKRPQAAKRLLSDVLERVPDHPGARYTLENHEAFTGKKYEPPPPLPPPPPGQKQDVELPMPMPPATPLPASGVAGIAAAPPANASASAAVCFGLPCVAVVTTLVDTPPRLLRTWLRATRVAGVSRAYLFFDDPHDATAAWAERLRRRNNMAWARRLVVVRCDAALRKAQRRESLWAKWSPFLGMPGQSGSMARQQLNVQSALRMAAAARDPPIAWLLHIDVDEAIHIPHPVGAPTHGMLASYLAQLPGDVGAARFANLEAVPPHADVVDPLLEIVMFKPNPGLPTPQSRPSWPRPQHFLSYTNGKSAVRVARWPAVEPDGVHLFRARFETLKYADAFARPFTPPQPALGEPVVLHFGDWSVRHWRRKYRRLAAFDDVHWNDTSKSILMWNGLSRDVFAGKITWQGGPDATRPTDLASVARAAYKGHVSIDDAATVDALLQAGELQRHVVRLALHDLPFTAVTIPPPPSPPGATRGPLPPRVSLAAIAESAGPPPVWGGTPEILSDAPPLYRLKNFLSPAMCDELLAASIMTSPSVKKSHTAGGQRNPLRQSTSLTMTDLSALPRSLHTLLGRTRSLLDADGGLDTDAGVGRPGTPPAQLPQLHFSGADGVDFEAPQIVMYGPGDHYGLHQDYDAKQSRLFRRRATLLVYLAAPEAGGETIFPLAAKRGEVGATHALHARPLRQWADKLPAESFCTVTNATCDAARLGFNRQHGMDYCCCAEALKVAATKGDALLFFPADAAGEADRRTLHGACPVRDGAKWVAQLWVTDVESLM